MGWTLGEQKEAYDGAGNERTSRVKDTEQEEVKG